MPAIRSADFGGWSSNRRLSGRPREDGTPEAPGVLSRHVGAIITLVFLGFAPTYYFRSTDAVPLPGYLHLHGAAMSAWFLLLLLQSVLIAAGRRSIYRRTGIAGAVIAAVIVLTNPFVVVGGFRMDWPLVCPSTWWR